MLYVLMLTVFLSSSTLNFSFAEVLETTEIVLVQKEIAVSEIMDNELITEKIEMDINVMDNYITEDMPEENPGWTQGRFYLSIKINESDKEQTEITIEAFFEKFGVRSAMLLIPPRWMPMPSNGILEQKILDEIEQMLISN